MLSSGLLYDSPLRRGHKILSVNGQSCAGQHPQDFYRLLGNDAILTIVAWNDKGDAHVVEAMMEKSRPDSSIGGGLARDSQGRLKISRMRSYNVLGHSVLNVGDRILRINSIVCDRIEPSLAMIRNSPARVTILAHTLRATEVVVPRAFGSQRIPPLHPSNNTQNPPPNTVLACVVGVVLVIFWVILLLLP